MQYLKVSQREIDKRYDFTCTHDHHTSPTGYCRPWSDWDEQWKMMHPIDYQQYVANKDKYHSHGHETAQEAANCYRSYLLDNRLFLNNEYSDAQYKCIVCKAYTNLYAKVDMMTYVLCKDHNNREEVERLFKVYADSEFWQS